MEESLTDSVRQVSATEFQDALDVLHVAVALGMEITAPAGMSVWALRITDSDGVLIWDEVYCSPEGAYTGLRNFITERWDGDGPWEEGMTDAEYVNDTVYEQRRRAYFASMDEDNLFDEFLSQWWSGAYSIDRLIVRATPERTI